jgi:hypothetical protein
VPCMLQLDCHIWRKDILYLLIEYPTWKCVRQERVTRFVIQNQSIRVKNKNLICKCLKDRLEFLKWILHRFHMERRRGIIIRLISALQLPPRHPVHISRMHVRVSLVHYCNHSDAFECLINFLGKISQVLGTNVPDD